MLKRVILAIIVLAAMSAASHAQTLTICSGQPVPSGYIVTHIQTNLSCGNGTNNQKTLTYIAGDPFGSTRFACNDGTAIPAGWVIQDTTGNAACGTVIAGNLQTIFNTKGAPIGTQETVCNFSPVPQGWQIIQTGLDIVPKCGSTEPSHVGEIVKNVSNIPPPPPPMGLAAVLQWGAQHPAIGHLVGHANADGTWTATVPGSQNWLSYGPNTTIATPGDYVAAWSLSVSNNSGSTNMANIDVNDAATQTEIATRIPVLNEFTAVNTPQTLTLPFSIDSTRAGHPFEFRVFWFATTSATESAIGYIPLQWNAQNPAIGHTLGTADNSTGFPGWSANVGPAGQNWLSYGPYTTLSQTGVYIALFTLQIDFNTNAGFNEIVAIVDLNDATTQTRLSSTTIHRQDFKGNHVDQVFQVPPVTIDSSRAGHQFEFRVFFNNAAYIREQAVGVVKVQ
jgi:hypothetical protein